MLSQHFTRRLTRKHKSRSKTKAKDTEEQGSNKENVCKWLAELFHYVKISFRNIFRNQPYSRTFESTRRWTCRNSKIILNEINASLRDLLTTSEIISFPCPTYRFLKIKDFYPSIPKKVLTDALTFAKTIIKLSDLDKKSIYHSRKLFLSNQEQWWMKKEGNLFDFLMGTLNGAEAYEFIHIFNWIY